MTGASDAVEHLRRAMDGPLKTIAFAVSHARACQEKLRACEENLDNVEDMMRAVANMVLACEALANAAKSADELGTMALLWAFDNTGVPGVYLDHHTVTRVDGAQGVAIITEEDVPDKFWTRKIDMKALGKALKAKEDVNGSAVLRNGTPYVSFRKRNQ